MRSNQRTAFVYSIHERKVRILLKTYRNKSQLSTTGNLYGRAARFNKKNFWKRRYVLSRYPSTTKDYGYKTDIVKPSLDLTFFQYFWRFTQICTKFAAFARKIVLLLFLNNFITETTTKTILRANAGNFCANLQKYWNNTMSNDGSSIDIIDQFHGD